MGRGEGSTSEIQSKTVTLNMHNEQTYLRKFLDPLKTCKRYQPKFGRGNTEEGLSLAQFLKLYEMDPSYMTTRTRGFSRWGLAHP
jgi:hypothetical protein